MSVAGSDPVGGAAPEAAEWTVLGAGGFVGSHLVAALERRGARVRAVGRGAALPATLSGHVVHCIGVSGDFRSRPLDTIRAHLGTLERGLRRGGFDSFLMLSSTRVYLGQQSGDESQAVWVNSTDPDQLYGLSKLAAESLCLALDHPRIRVARLGSLYGPGMDGNMFLGRLLDRGRQDGVCIRESPDQMRDHLHVGDAVEGLIRIACSGRERLYNVASGRLQPNRDLAKILEEYGIRCGFASPGLPVRPCPEIALHRLEACFREAGEVWRPRSLRAGLGALLAPGMENGDGTVVENGEKRDEFQGPADDRR